MTEEATSPTIDRMPRLGQAALLGVALTLALSASAPAKTSQSIPAPPTTDVARFKMTIDGYQVERYQFVWTPAPSGCSRHAEGLVTEHWRFQRGRGLEVDFAKLPGGLVVVQRHGRFGDASFAAPGTLRRHASGYFDSGGEPGCGGVHPLDQTTCDHTYKVQSDLRFIWKTNKLTLDRAATKLLTNPADSCGSLDDSSTTIALFSFPYPLFSKQKDALTKKQIFGHKHALRLVLKDHFLEPVEPNPEVNSSEHLNGLSEVTLERMKD